jgi:hypothetical protein
MEMPSPLKRPDWWLLAIVICALWVIDCVLDGNTFLETLTGPVIVALWAGGIYLIDRWVVKLPDPAEPPRSDSSANPQ